MTWKKIKDYNQYSINEKGEVKNNKTQKILSQWMGKNGYYYVSLQKDGKGHPKTVHRLLAKAFIPNPHNRPCIDHKDGNRQNNSLSNLRWATYGENNSRFDTLGVRSEKIKVTHYKELRKKRGGGHIGWLSADEILYFDRIKDAANHFGVTISNISLMLKNNSIGRRGKMRCYRFEYCKSKCERVTTIESTQKCGSE